ncbi:MAG: hypothetical protein KGZ93_00620 [Actinobacteria bacterium]|nr:hypothetical protein [Actinomycetota bacterium]
MRDFLDWFGNAKWVVKIPLILTASIIILGVLWFGASSLSDVGSEQNTGYDVEYSVTGSSKRAIITYTNEKGWTNKLETAVPWRWKSPAGAPAGTSLYVSAQARDSGSIKVEIIVDGKVWKEQENFGPFVMATASGYAGDK